MWDTQVAIDWLTSIGADQGVPLVAGGVGVPIPDMPDRLGVVTDTSGGPLRMDGLVDAPSFQLRFRGSPADQFDAQRLALAADRLILFADLSTLTSGVRLYSVTRSGGRPTALHAGPSPGLRSEYVCTYMCSVSMF